jgi:hypothetical protein
VAAAAAAGDSLGPDMAHTSLLYSNDTSTAFTAAAGPDAAAAGHGAHPNTAPAAGDNDDNSSSSSSSSDEGSGIQGWGAVPGSFAATYSSFSEYIAARREGLEADLGPGEGVSALMEASYEVACSNGPEVRWWEDTTLTGIFSCTAPNLVPFTFLLTWRSMGVQL